MVLELEQVDYPLPAQTGAGLKQGQQGDGQAEQANKKQLLKNYLLLFGHAYKANRTVVAYDLAARFLMLAE